MATNAGKLACYAPMHSGVRMRFGDLEQCLDAAVSGEWFTARADLRGLRNLEGLGVNLVYSNVNCSAGGS
jgi:hypothetical protein